MSTDTKNYQSSRMFGVITYKRKKFGEGAAAWLAFGEWMREIIGRTCEVSQLTDDECHRLIAAMRQLHDVPDPDQPALFEGV